MTQGESAFYRWSSAALFLVAAVVIAVSFDDYGVTWDEPFHLRYGERIFQYFASGFENQDAALHTNLRYYGGAFDLAGELARRVSPFGAFETRHLLNAVVGVVGVLGCWMLGRTLGGDRTAFLAAALLLLTPRWFGHSFNNPKDIPFAAGYVWSVYFLVRAVPELPRIRPRRALSLGSAIGLTLAMRVGGLILFAYLGLAMAVQLVFQASRDGLTAATQTALRYVPSLFLVVATAWGLMIAFWPWAHSRPVAAPAEVLRLMSDFPWRGTVLFAGAEHHVTQLPRTYTSHWLVITLPEVVLVGLGVGVGLVLWSAVRGEMRLGSPESKQHAMVVLSAVFPIVYVAVQKPIIYDGLRHALFVIPPLVCLASRALDVTFERLWRWSSSLALAAVVVLGVYLAYHVSLMIRLHPHQYVYFNQTVGGLSGAHGRYETDYWGNSYREAVRLLVDRLRMEGEGQPPHYRVYVCSNPESSTYFFPVFLSRTRNEEEADFFIATTRWNCHERLDGTIVGVVERMGTPLAYVKDRRKLVPPRRRY